MKWFFMAIMAIAIVAVNEVNLGHRGFFIINSLKAEEFKVEKVRKILTAKKSLYFENGIFHNGPSKDSGELASIRQSYNEKDKYERIVIDFKGNEVPRIYGSFQSQEKKIYIDLFKSYLLGNFSTISSTRYVEKVHFYPIEKDHVSVELWLKDQVVIEVFSLQNPGRLVIDLKK